MNDATQHNRCAWDDRVRGRKAHTATAKEKEFENPLAVVDDLGWLNGDVHGRRVLCLGAGGGKHSVLFAAAGAVVTVVDLSPKILELDRHLAAERRLKIHIVETSMEDLSALMPSSFDVVIQPVSTCYIADVRSVYREVARVTGVGGLYISQHKQPASLQANLLLSPRGYVVSEPYYRSGPLPDAMEGSQHREAGTIEFLHRWEELLGGLCRSGFVIEDLAEPHHGSAVAEPGSFGHRSLYLPPFVTIKARRLPSESRGVKGPRLWTPPTASE